MTPDDDSDPERDTVRSIAEGLGLSAVQADQLFDSLTARGVRISPVAAAERSAVVAEESARALQSAGERDAAALQSAGQRSALALDHEGGRNAAALQSAGQRRVNLIWETTQASIALLVSVSTLGSAATLVFRGGADLAAFVLLSDAFFLVIGFYFGRTNHQRVGGVGPHEEGR